MSIKLDDLEATAKAATPGPWQHLPYGGQNQNGDYSGGEIYEANGEHLISDVSDEAGSHIATFDPPTVLALIAKLREAEAEAARYKSAMRRALAFESVLPAIATEPRRMLTAALAYKPTNQEGSAS